ncbi:hypothetical protein ON010_g4004 [Phytophthora cinnamomi]|nr:hypothetical protein ON010_g4004 [Phytophthora cinnamomi]
MARAKASARKAKSAPRDVHGEGKRLAAERKKTKAKIKAKGKAKHAAKLAKEEKKRQARAEATDAPQDEDEDGFIEFNADAEDDAKNSNASNKDEEPQKGENEAPTLMSRPWMRHKQGYFNSNVYACLHEEIMDFVGFISPTPQELSSRAQLVEEMREIVKGLWPEATVETFGSHYTQMFLPQSDIDMVLFGVPEGKAPLFKLAQCLEEKELVSYLEVIDKARIPIVKMVHKASDIHVDVSFNVAGGLATGDLVKHYMRVYPSFRPLTLVLKYFMAQRAAHGLLHALRTRFQLHRPRHLGAQRRLVLLPLPLRRLPPPGPAEGRGAARGRAVAQAARADRELGARQRPAQGHAVLGRVHGAAAGGRQDRRHPGRPPPLQCGVAAASQTGACCAGGLLGRQHHSRGRLARMWTLAADQGGGDRHVAVARRVPAQDESPQVHGEPAAHFHPALGAASAAYSDRGDHAGYRTRVQRCDADGDTALAAAQTQSAASVDPLDLWRAEPGDMDLMRRPSYDPKDFFNAIRENDPTSSFCRQKAATLEDLLSDDKERRQKFFLTPSAEEAGGACCVAALAEGARACRELGPRRWAASRYCALECLPRTAACRQSNGCHPGRPPPLQCGAAARAGMRTGGIGGLPGGRHDYSGRLAEVRPRLAHEAGGDRHVAVR